MNMLALDLGTSLGYCLGAGDKIPRLGSVLLPTTGDDVGLFGVFFWKWLNAMLEQEEIDLVVFEAPMLPGARIDPKTGNLIKAPTTIQTTRKLQGLAVITEVIVKLASDDLVAAGYPEIRCREVFLQTAKKELGGSGKASKLDMMTAAKRCGVNPRIEDEADAFGVWLVGIRHYRKAFAPMWDKKLWSGRGLL